MSSRPNWLPDISGVEETMVGLFALNEGDAEMFAEAFEFARQEAQAAVIAAIREEVERLDGWVPSDGDVRIRRSALLAILDRHREDAT